MPSHVLENRQNERERDDLFFINFKEAPAYPMFDLTRRYSLSIVQTVGEVMQSLSIYIYMTQFILLTLLVSISQHWTRFYLIDFPLACY